MEFYGKIIFVGAIASGESQRGTWQRQEFVVETFEQYPKRCAFTVFGAEKINEFSLNAGDIVKVEFNVDAREYNGRWFNTLQAWRVTREGGNSYASAPSQQQAVQSQGQMPFAPQGAFDDNLPY